jgi:hypothetical protein
MTASPSLAGALIDTANCSIKSDSHVRISDCHFFSGTNMELRKFKIIPVLAFLTLIIISCNTATATQASTTIPSVIPTIIVENTPTPSQGGSPQTEADVPRVSVEDAAAAMQNGEVVVLDVRSAQAYQVSHNRLEPGEGQVDHHLLHLTAGTYERPCGVCPSAEWLSKSNSHPRRVPGLGRRRAAGGAVDS